MIHPTTRAAVALGIAAPIGLVIAFAAPTWWIMGPAWLAVVLAAIGADAASLVLRRISAEVRPPAVLHVGEPDRIAVRIACAAAIPIHFNVDVEGPAAPLGYQSAKVGADGTLERHVEIRTHRRGQVRLKRLWLRTHGPLGFAARTLRRRLDMECAVVPNIVAVKRQAIAFTASDAPLGVKPQYQKGTGSEFEALREYAVGLDPRTIDWKHTARDRKLLCKEFQTERNHHVVLALDAGHLMAETVDGLPKLDHAIGALLLLGYVSLKSGDKVGLTAFDSRTRAFVSPSGNVATMAHLQRALAAIDYSTEETNFTLALAELRGRLSRRSLIVIATDFVDTITADLMIENVGYLARRHLIVFVALSDTSLEHPFARRPEDLEDVARAVVAHDLMRERQAVFARLARLGVLCIESPASQLGPALVNRYLAVKARDQI
ncbi:MAG: DUF58 domain-containing protein [Gammaproteobacteria bacterium]|nr:DUF58 domain-containing protein [Gammaproteobacteria bacterium]